MLLRNPGPIISLATYRFRYVLYTQRVRGKPTIVGALVAALTLIGGVEAAGAATLRAEYRFQGDLASEVAGAPELANLGQGNRFAVERIDGLGRYPVLSFPEGNGLSLATTGLVDPTNNSVVMVFRFANTSVFGGSSTSPAGLRTPGYTTSTGKWCSTPGARAMPARTSS
jgi:hypothetical protein